MTALRVPSERARTIRNHLVHERQLQLMRKGTADQGLLEANRLAIIYWQRQLSRSLAAEHTKAEDRRTA
jgi:hypothetical protein